MWRLKTSLIFIFLLIIPCNVLAVTCDYEEKAKLNNEIVNVKVNYEVKQRLVDKSEYNLPDEVIGTDEEDTYELWNDYLQVNILNLTENMYVEVSNDYDDEVRTIYYSETENGNISFDRYDVNSVIKYTITVYASSKSSCVGNVIKSLYLTLPRYNQYSEYEMCNSVPDYSLCQKFVTSNEVDFDTFVDSVNKQIEKISSDDNLINDNDKWYQAIKDFFIKYKIPFIIGGGVLVVSTIVTIFIIIKKRRRSVI